MDAEAKLIGKLVDVIEKLGPLDREAMERALDYLYERYVKPDEPAETTALVDFSAIQHRAGEMMQALELQIAAEELQLDQVRADSGCNCPECRKARLRVREKRYDA